MKRYILPIMAAIILLSITVTLPFVILNPEGRPYMTLEKLKMPRFALPKMPDYKGFLIKAKKDFGGKKRVLSTESGMIYVWQNENGIWCFSDEPNPDGPCYVLYANKAKPVKAIKGKAEKRGSHGTKSRTASPEAAEKPSDQQETALLPVLQAPQIIEQAKQLKQQVDKRNEEMDRLVGSDVSP